MSIDQKNLKSPPTWFWKHVKGHQYDKTGTLYRRDTPNTECDTKAKQKWKEYQEAGSITTRPHNIRYGNWRLFTNVPTSSDVKGTPHWEKRF